MPATAAASPEIFEWEGMFMTSKPPYTTGASASPTGGGISDPRTFITRGVDPPLILCFFFVSS